MGRIKRRGLSPKMGDEFIQKVYKTCGPYTMTGPRKMYALYQAVKYVIRENIPGCMVECGVWKGGSSMIMATTMRLYEECRLLYLYDTYAGMSMPSEKDRKQDPKKLQQDEVMNKWEQEQQKTHNEWCYSSLENVKKNLNLTGHPDNSIFFIEGKVEETLQTVVPRQGISVLRLDTDWYKSTKEELEILYPLLAIGGILIIDDYYTWGGQREAVEEFFGNIEEKSTRIDGGIVCVKSESGLLSFDEGIV